MYEVELDFLKEFFYTANQKFCKMPFTVSEKGSFDVVTDVDRAIERDFRERLNERFPQDRLHGEEFSYEAPLRDRTWILDPIDGTYNFSTGSPHYGHQAALWDRGELKICAIYLPEFDEMYVASKGQGAFCNGRAIRVSKKDTKDAIFTFGDFPHQRPRDASHQIRIMENAIHKITRCRMFGAASVDFAYLASGRTEGTILFTKNKWDIAPGLLLVREAGGVALAPTGEEYSFDCRGIFAANKQTLFDEMMEGITIER